MAWISNFCPLPCDGASVPVAITEQPADSFRTSSKPGRASVATSWIGSKQEPSLTWTKFSPLDARFVRTQPRTVTFSPTATPPERACCTLTTAMT